MQRTTVFGECRWVQDNQIIAATCLIQELKRIVTECLMTLIAWEVQLHISIGQFDGLGTAINGMNQFCTASHRIEREASRVTEHIKNLLSLSILLQ